eukprot:TRINITY_DN16805_c0_g1_i1.p1 TRINITY_DN16805_c0_g1~~TRINITY_DN16805_c0_g1_i1.p1  ORF type:complete len:185 (-),score=10.49 TRINITY_DN16805_c0_g1_i1:266-820(-)
MDEFHCASFDAKKEAQESSSSRNKLKGLCSDLSSLLPSERLQGKRSLCERLEETARYITWLKDRIQSFEDKAHLQLPNTAENKNNDNSRIKARVGDDLRRVEVRSIGNGDEWFLVIVNGAQKHILLSQLMEMVEGAGASIMDVSSFTMKDFIFLTLLSKVGKNVSAVDWSALCNVIYSYAVLRQ